MINAARLQWLQQAHNASTQLVALRDTLDNLSQQHNLGLYGHAVDGILDSDLEQQAQFANVTKVELDTWVVAINGLITAMGVKTDGNTPMGASLKFLG